MPIMPRGVKAEELQALGATYGHGRWETGMMMPQLPLNEKEKAQLRQIENRYEVQESDVQDVASMLLKVVEWIEQREFDKWCGDMGDDL